MQLPDIQKIFHLWLKRAGLLVSDQEGAGRIRAAQIQAVVRFTPLMMVVNLVNAAVIVWFVKGFSNPWLLAGWTLAIGFIVATSGYAWYVRRGAARRPTASTRAIRRATLHAAILAIFWAAVPAMWLPETAQEARLMMGTLITGMICAGGFALATIPTAAFTYVIILTLGAMIGVFESIDHYVIPFGILLIAYSAAVLRSVDGTSKMFIQRFQAEAELAERGEIIELLLNEFEENSSDWLFQTNNDWTLVEHSARFSIVAGKPDQSLIGINLSELIHADSFSELSNKRTKGAAFKDFEVRSSLPSGAWWSLTAKPVYAKTGEHIGWRGVGSDIDDKKTSEQQLERLAYFDPLTGLSNRAKFMEVVDASIREAEEKATSRVLMVIDLDQFKMVNDSLGHDAGDELLQVTAKILTGILGKANFAARLGNDEFGVILSNQALIDHEDDVARQIINAFQAPVPLRAGNVTICVSIGIVRIPEHGMETEHLMRNADLALMKAKEIGGSGFAIFEETMNEVFQDRAELARDLRQAASIEGQLEVWYQPQIDVKRGTIAGFEALMRWKHPVRGYIPPSEFIPIAESSGLISSIGRWILKEAVLQAHLWQINTGQDVPVAVNLSVAQLWHSNIIGHITDLLKDSGLPPHLLCLEMTESVFADHEASRVRKVLAELKALGIVLALDDFGTGYSSLSYLHQLPFDKLKIDRSFVTNSVTGQRQRNLLEGIVNLGHGLGMSVIAEGVETADELKVLQDIGCEQIQGYFFGKPAPAPIALARAIERVTIMNLETKTAPLPTLKSA